MTIPARNINAEAEFWHGNLRPTSPLKDALADIEGELLVRAYNVWWGAYSSGVRRSATRAAPKVCPPATPRTR